MNVGHSIHVGASNARRQWSTLILTRLFSRFVALAVWNNTDFRYFFALAFRIVWFLDDHSDKWHKNSYATLKWFDRNRRLNCLLRRLKCAQSEKCKKFDFIPLCSFVEHWSTLTMFFRYLLFFAEISDHVIRLSCQKFMHFHFGLSEALSDRSIHYFSYILLSLVHFAWLRATCKMQPLSLRKRNSIFFSLAHWIRKLTFDGDSRCCDYRQLFSLNSLCANEKYTVSSLPCEILKVATESNK